MVVSRYHILVLVGSGAGDSGATGATGAAGAAGAAGGWSRLACGSASAPIPTPTRPVTSPVPYPCCRISPCVAQGYYKEDKRCGFGLYNWMNGDRYGGGWKNGRMHGKGVKIMANGDVYNGMWECDKAQGWGVKVSAISSHPLNALFPTPPTPPSPPTPPLHNPPSVHTHRHALTHAPTHIPHRTTLT